MIKQNSFQALGCQWQIQTEKEHPEIKEITKNFEDDFSRFNPNSQTSAISNFIGEKEITLELHNLLTIAERLYKATKGKFNPLIGQTLQDLGYDSNYTLKPKKKISAPPSLENAFELSANKIKTKSSLQFDFGGLGKGYLIDKIKKLLIQKKEENFLINGSGDIYHHGEKTIRAGLEDPNNSQKIIGITEIKNASLCASAQNRRTWQNISHILDPTDLSQKENQIIATWVISKEATIADAIATSLFFSDPIELQNHFNFDFLILNKDYKIWRSENFKLVPPS